VTSKRLLIASFAAALASALTVAVASAQGPPDKSGGSKPVTLTLLNDDNSNLNGVPAVQHFIDLVQKLSGGNVTIRVKAIDWTQPDVEQHVVDTVRTNGAQLAWVGTRVFDTLGVGTFRALQAPMLVDSYATEAAVLRSDLPSRMLEGLDGHGIVGLALLGDNLRFPASAKHPLLEPGDFRGINFGTYKSTTQAQALTTLGARPVFTTGADRAPFLRSGRLDAIEIDLKTYEDNAYASVAPDVTLNLPLWPRTTVLFGNAHVLSKLSDDQRKWIRQAAAAAQSYALTTLSEDQRILPLECRNGMNADLASPTQLAAMRKAFAPAYVALRRDPVTARMIAAITTIKRGVKNTPLVLPKSCAGRHTSGAFQRAATFPEGVYRFRRTKSDILRVWPDADTTSIRLLSATETMTFHHGNFSALLSGGGVPGCRHGDGHYTTSGHLLTVTWTDFHGCKYFRTPSDSVTLRWTYDGKALHFRTVGAQRPADHATWEATPFVRIG
jgi:TRAP-type C4-dicarboxylate transport system substrate-binding protein